MSLCCEYFAPEAPEAPEAPTAIRSKQRVWTLDSWATVRIIPKARVATHANCTLHIVYVGAPFPIPTDNLGNVQRDMMSSLMRG